MDKQLAVFLGSAAVVVFAAWVFQRSERGKIRGSVMRAIERDPDMSKAVQDARELHMGLWGR